MQTARSALETLGLSPDTLPNTTDEQIDTIKKKFRELARTHHPDKGGDAQVFTEIDDAFRTLLDRLAIDLLDRFDEPLERPASTERPSWQDFASLSSVVPPTTKYELAPTSKSRCASTNELIPKGAVRVGSLMPASGTYSNHRLLEASRVPAAIWKGLTVSVANGIEPTVEDLKSTIETLEELEGDAHIGFAALPDDAKRLVAAHVVQSAHHAKEQIMKPKPTPKPSTAIEATSAPRFQAPVPGVDAVEGCLSNQTVVLTGIFDAVGSGIGLAAGKDALKALLERYGAKVTGSVSKKTTLVMVGRDPGASKLTAASKFGVKLASLTLLLKMLKRGRVNTELGEPDDPEPIIDSLSSGFFGKGKGRALTNERAAELGLKKQKCIE